MLITSVFEDHQPIPKQYTCEGENISPALTFSDIPHSTQSLVLIMDDPDAPNGTFDHWIVWNIPPSVTKLSDHAPELEQLTQQIGRGINHYGKNIYNGPCPPPGKPHRYYIQLYAIDILLTLPQNSKKQDVLTAIKGHVIENATLIGTYQR